MGLMKVFSGRNISNGFKRKIEAIGVDTVMKIIFNQLDRVLEAQVLLEVLYKKLILQKQIQLWEFRLSI
jgi:hypothetical protein